MLFKKGPKLPKFKCKHCHKKFPLKNHHPGDKIACPYCNTQQYLPQTLPFEIPWVDEEGNEIAPSSAESSPSDKRRGNASGKSGKRSKKESTGTRSSGKRKREENRKSERRGKSRTEKKGREQSEPSRKKSKRSGKSSSPTPPDSDDELTLQDEVAPTRRRKSSRTGPCPYCGADIPKSVLICPACMVNLQTGQPAVRKDLKNQTNWLGVFKWVLVLAAMYGVYWLIQKYSTDIDKVKKEIVTKGDNLLDDSRKEYQQKKENEIRRATGEAEKITAPAKTQAQIRQEEQQKAYEQQLQQHRLKDLAGKIQRTEYQMIAGKPLILRSPEGIVIPERKDEFYARMKWVERFKTKFLDCFEINFPGQIKENGKRISVPPPPISELETKPTLTPQELLALVALKMPLLVKKNGIDNFRLARLTRRLTINPPSVFEPWQKGFNASTGKKYNLPAIALFIAMNDSLFVKNKYQPEFGKVLLERLQNIPPDAVSAWIQRVPAFQHAEMEAAFRLASFPVFFDGIRFKADFFKEVIAAEP